MHIACRFQIHPFEIVRKTDNTVIIWFFTYFHTRHILVKHLDRIFILEPTDNSSYFDEISRLNFPKDIHMQDVSDYPVKSPIQSLQTELAFKLYYLR